jgi:hypothetical protein
MVSRAKRCEKAGMFEAYDDTASGHVAGSTIDAVKWFRGK